MKLQHSSAVRRRARILRSVALAVVVMIPAVSADAAPRSLTSDQVAAEILRVQDEADAIAGRLAEAEQKSQDLAVELAKAKAQLAATTASQQHLDQQLGDIAVSRFTGSSETPLIFSGNLTDRMQKEALLNVALDNGAATADTMQSVHLDLARQQRHLESLQRQQRQVLDVLSTSKTQVEQKLQQLATLRVQLKNAEVLRAYQQKVAAQRAQQAAAARAAAARNVATTPAAPRGSGNVTAAGTSSGSISTPTPAPVVVRTGAFICPINGPSAFIDTWGAPRSGGRHHEGVDMMSPFGTPLVAVVSGFAHYGPNALGGNTIWLNGSDGNGYYYAHLSSYAGYSRQVRQGELLGYVGHTGDTVANHLHFEIHPGEGPAVDPYPTVRQYC